MKNFKRASNKWKLENYNFFKHEKTCSIKDCMSPKSYNNKTKPKSSKSTHKKAKITWIRKESFVVSWKWYGVRHGNARKSNWKHILKSILRLNESGALHIEQSA